MEPPKKQQKTDDGDLKEMLMSMQCTFVNKLKSIEEKIDKISTRYHMLEEKVENVLLKIKDAAKGPRTTISCSSNGSASPRFISCNDEAAYPDGSWLGDPHNPDLRVRCLISPLELENINNTCTTPEKLSLTLLDHLFDRETQAQSNISGTGKHGKEQLDPLRIFGIKCHVVYMFGTNDKDWQRIKRNIDSKCRTAFRRKQKGMPLGSKGCRERIPHSFKRRTSKSLESSVLPESLVKTYYAQDLIIPKPEPLSFANMQENVLEHIIPLKLEGDACSLTFTDALSHSQIIHTEHGDIQVIQATEEQLEQLKRNHQIEILTQADILTDGTLAE